MKNSFTFFLIILGLVSCRSDVKKEENTVVTHRPNVIYILADDLGYGDLGCYGQEKIKTPIIDEMAQNGMKFTSHYAGNTVCAPSRASLMTGLHQGHAPVRGNRNNILGADDITLARLFKSNGYKTAMIGKWGLGEIGSSGEPNKQGFDSYFGYLNQIHAHNYYTDYLIKNGDSIPLDNIIVKQTEGYAKGIGQAATIKKDYSHSMFIQEALSFIGSDHEKPFFLYLPLTIPHANNEGHLTAEHGMEVPDLGMYENEDWPEVEKAKAAMISLLDADVGRILDILKSKGLDENTLVIFTSDNGPHQEGGVNPDFFDSNGELRGIKRDLYEGGIRVPFIAQWKGKIKPNSTSDLSTAFWDIMPTFSELVGANLTGSTDGISFLPTLMGEVDSQMEHDYLYWEFAEGDHDAQAVRSGDWKLLHIYKSDTWELYNLSTDIGENKNVIDENREIFERLKGFMEKAHRFDADYPLQGEPNA
ncbi:arylsulfatase [Maribacter halichondriae]|uniref:arylsulfatase n=1 Tax=Maribacter halichondriae TaxID=2980554 RepID=UPI0023599764|nr:arylsulfatase [Maribacter sp. Hal144]